MSNISLPPSTMDSFNGSGYIQNTLHQGVTSFNALSEYTDGSKDAGAENVHINFNTMNKTIYHSDDGCGMTKSELERANIRCARREHVQEGQTGFFGDGKKVGGGVLSQLKTPLRTISCGSDNVLSAIDVDLPTAVATGRLTLLATTLKRGDDMWDEYAVDATGNGTVDVIPCAPEKFDELLLGVTSGTLLDAFRKTYRERLLSDEHPFNISFFIDEEEYPLGRDDVFDENNSEVHHVTAKVIDMDGVIRTCFNPQGTDKLHYYAAEKLDELENKVVLPDEVLHVIKEGDRVIGDLNVTLILANDPRTGGIHIQRGDRILDTIKHTPVTSGDIGARNYYMGTHTIVKFSPNKEMDKLLGVQVDKGNVVRANIHRNIMLTLEKVADSWVKPKWKARKPKTDKNVVKGDKAIIEALRRRVAELEAENARLTEALD